MYWHNVIFQEGIGKRELLYTIYLHNQPYEKTRGEAVITDLSEHLMVLNTCPDSGTAGRIAAELVDGKLAACVQVLPGLQSYFHWDGKVERADEYLLLIKTTSASYPALEQRIRELHPYELPEIIGVPVSRGLPGYLSWIDECTHKDA